MNLWFICCHVLWSYSFPAHLSFVFIFTSSPRFLLFLLPSLAPTSVWFCPSLRRIGEPLSVVIFRCLAAFSSLAMLDHKFCCFLLLQPFLFIIFPFYICVYLPISTSLCSCCTLMKSWKSAMLHPFCAAIFQISLSCCVLVNGGLGSVKELVFPSIIWVSKNEQNQICVRFLLWTQRNYIV